MSNKINQIDQTDQIPPIYEIYSVYLIRQNNILYHTPNINNLSNPSNNQLTFGSSVNVTFFKYAGVYMALIESDNPYTTSNQLYYFESKEVQNQIIKRLRNEFSVRKKPTPNKHYKIESLNCPCCSIDIYVRSYNWNTLGKFPECEKLGYEYICEATIISSKFNPQTKTTQNHTETYVSDLINKLSTVDDFLYMIEYEISSDYKFECDECGKDKLLDDIYFCEQCFDKSEYYNICESCLHTDKKLNHQVNQLNQHPHNYIHPSTHPHIRKIFKERMNTDPDGEVIDV